MHKKAAAEFKQVMAQMPSNHFSFSILNVNQRKKIEKNNAQSPVCSYSCSHKEASFPGIPHAVLDTMAF